MKKQLNEYAMIFFLTLFAGGCQAAAPVQPTIPMLTAPAQTEPASQTLSLDTFKNTEFFGLQSQRSVQLADGQYEGGSGADYLSMKLLPQAAFGDVNGDGIEDAALLLSENMGGSGTFVSLTVMVSTTGGYTQSLPVQVDDRPLINLLTIEGEQVVLDATIHSTGDTMTNPSMQVVETFRYLKGKLVLMRLDSNISGAERRITIDNPISEQEVSGSVRVQGSMPIAPFENNLVYRLFNENNSLIDTQSFMVTAADVGAPATFDNTIPLPSLDTGSKVRIELAELSMADGSTLCLNSVEVFVR